MANVGDGLLTSGETGAASAMITKLDRRCALEDDVEEGAILYGSGAHGGGGGIDVGDR